MSKTITNQQIDNLNNMANELRDNFDDPDKTNAILKDMLNELGEEPMFETLDDFISFIDSGETLVL